MLSLEDGKFLIKLCRRTLERFYDRGELEIESVESEKFRMERGLFVTIKTFPSKRLRGCIGIVSPSPLYEAVQRAAVSAAFKDPRFRPLKKEELDDVVFEISIMTEPTLISNCDLEELEQKIEVGCDGLMISNGVYNGLLLPQVAVEQNWDVEDFLKHLCIKAGMTESFLEDEETRIWKFQCQVFSELKPGGKIEEVDLS